MKNELEVIEGWLTSERGTMQSNTELLSVEWMVEKDQFLRAIMKNVLQLSSEKQIRYYVCWYQDRLTRLADNLFLNSDKSQQGHPGLDFLIDLIKEFQFYFASDVDEGQGIPYGMLHRQQDIVADIAKKVRIYFDKVGVAQHLTTVALIPADEFNLIGRQRVTFQRLYYLETYLAELQQVDLNNSLYSQADLTVIDLLVRLNYNHVRFLNFAIDHITRSIKERANPQEKLALLNEYLKMVNQVPEMKELSYQAALPSVKAQLNRWLSEEVDCLKNTSTDEPDKLPPLKLNLSVSQMAYLTSLFFKQGVFMEPVKAKVFRSMTQTFSSRETARISPGSFTTKSKEPGDSAVMGVRKLLRAMVQEIDEYLN